MNRGLAPNWEDLATVLANVPSSYEGRLMQSAPATLPGSHAAQQFLHIEHRKKEDVWPFGLTDKMLLCN